MNHVAYWLVNTPVKNPDFQNRLGRATLPEIQEALAEIQGKPGCKTKERALLSAQARLQRQARVART